MANGDPRYHRDAYFFLREALDYTQKSAGKARKGEIRHVTGQELLGGIRQYALQQFGPMTLTVLGEWGIFTCEDFGEMVFNMVESSLLAKTETDSRKDFKNSYDFNEAFCQPFLPLAKKEIRQVTPL
ncbi:MAG: Minf_1886 family protein [Verrucomicrobiota bacterium]